MEELKRITPEQVLVAYEKCGKKPGTGALYRGDTDCCCGLGAICMGELDLSPEYLDLNNPNTNNNGYIELYSTYGREYITGFWHGFDNTTQGASPIWISKKLLGIKDGVAARLAVEEKYGRLGE